MRRLWIPAAAGMAVLALALVDHLLGGPLSSLEGAAAAGARSLAAPPWGLLLFGVTQAGDWWFTLPALAVVAGLLARRHRPREAWALVLAVVVTEVASLLLKALVGRPRPADALLEAAGLAFPSGHAARAAAVALLAVALAPDRHRVAALALGVAWVAAVAASRVVFGVHHLLDVVGGVGLGLAAAGFVLSAEASSRPPPRGPAPP